jgi:hypothetical protein
MKEISFAFSPPLNFFSSSISRKRKRRWKTFLALLQSRKAEKKCSGK